MMMYDPVLKWKACRALGVKEYHIQWTINGKRAGQGTVTSTPAYESIGYIRRFSQDNPDMSIEDGDLVGATVQALDETGNFSIPVMPTPPMVAIPTESPDPPSGVTLSL